MPSLLTIQPGTTLEQVLEKAERESPDDFPGIGSDHYAARYRGCYAYLKKNVWPHLTVGALLAQIRDGSIKSDEALLLTDHGEEHVKVVLERAAGILADTGAGLYPYEVYILLMGIIFHDVGVLLGRQEHERKCAEIMGLADLKAFLSDSTEKKFIASIAAAHSGQVDGGSRDTIGQLRDPEHFDGKELRLRFLAAILRLADELADDRRRAARLLQLIQRMPAKSARFHDYSHAVQSVRVENGSIVINYEVTRTSAHKEYGTKRLIDEMRLRLYKMHREIMYCMRFWPRDYRPIRGVSGVIAVGEDPEADLLAEPLQRFSFTLEERGYPPELDSNCTLCLGDEDSKSRLPSAAQVIAVFSPAGTGRV